MENISEKDLYNFVFYPGELTDEKTKFISENKDKFADELDLLYELKKHVNDEVSDSTMTRIWDKIKEAESKRKIILEKLEHKKDQKYLTLAAESEQTSAEITSESFIDPGKRFLVKLIKSDDETKIFVFDTKESETDNIQLEIIPSGELYDIDLSNQPLVVPALSKTEKIIISV